MAVPVTITLHGQSQCILDNKGKKIDLQERSLNRKRISHTKTKVITLPNYLSPRNRSSKLCENTKNSQLFTLTPRVINLIQTKNKKEKKKLKELKMKLEQTVGKQRELREVPTNVPAIGRTSRLRQVLLATFTMLYLIFQSRYI